MILGIGTDIVSNSRMESVISKHGEKFTERIFSEKEKKYFRGIDKRRAIQRMGASFAAKEAFAKAIGTGFRYGISFPDIAIVRDPRGKPLMNLSGKAGEFARNMGAQRIHLSISHEKSHSLAVVIIES